MSQSNFHIIAMDSEQSQENGNLSIPIIRFFEFFGFIIAFWLLYTFFLKFSLNYIVIAILAFIFSLAIIKTDLLFYIIQNIKVVRNLKRILKTSFKLIKSVRYLPRWIFNKIKFRGWVTEIPQKVKITIIYGIIVTKQIFFNVSYDLFPMLLIWLSILGIAYLFGLIESPITENFISSITAFSILLGIFQYFLKRHEDKIFSKISKIQKKIAVIIIEESSFDNFYKSINNLLTKDFINSNIQPKITGLDFYKMLVNDPEFKKIYDKYFKKGRRIPINVGLTNNLSSEQKYSLLEMVAENPAYSYNKKLLSVAYRKFFHDIAYPKIKERIKKEIDIKEFKILTISNINIIQEVIPDLINIKLQKSFEELAMAKKVDFDILEPSAERYRQCLFERVNAWLQNDILQL